MSVRATSGADQSYVAMWDPDSDHDAVTGVSDLLEVRIVTFSPNRLYVPTVLAEIVAKAILTLCNQTVAHLRQGQAAR